MGVARKTAYLLVTWWMLALSVPQTLAMLPPIPQGVSQPFFCRYATDDLWNYLRKGLCYLESPSPLLPPEAVSPAYMHPDTKGFGAYGLTPAAYEDVQRAYPFFRVHGWKQVLASAPLYELANRAFADILLSNLQSYIPRHAAKKEVFQVLHQAWNVGLSGFKSGKKAVVSRFRRAGEFVGKNT